MSIKKLSDAAAMMVVAAMVGCSPNDTTVNIALNKAAYASSSYDYNLTAQLVTDGGVAASEPAWLKGNCHGARRNGRWTRDHIQATGWKVRLISLNMNGVPRSFQLPACVSGDMWFMRNLRKGGRFLVLLGTRRSE